jgi:hypothetical protein
MGKRKAPRRKRNLSRYSSVSIFDLKQILFYLPIKLTRMDVNDKVSNQSGLAVTRKKKFLKCQMNLYLFKRNTKNSYR